MTTVQKLALDFGYPWFWPLAIGLALLNDFDFLHSLHYTGAFSGGLMLALQGTFCAPKVALWRTLPVSDTEIGRARWWQMVGIPSITILTVMALAAVLHVLIGPASWNHQLPGASLLLSWLSGQLLYPVLVTFFTLAISIARAIRSPLAIMAVVLLLLVYLASIELPLLLPHLSQVLWAQALGLASLVAAAILYVTAPRWPQPATQPMQIDMGSRRARAAVAGRAGQGGWAALCGIALSRPVLVVAGMSAFWIILAVALKLDRDFILQLRFIISLMVVLQITIFNAMALRLLGALPGSAWRLSAYLFLLPLALVAAINCGFFLILEPWLTGDVPRINIVALSAMLLGCALALPAMIGVRQIGMVLVLMAGMALVPLIEFGWDYVPPPLGDERLLMGVTAAAICAGFFWMHAQVSRGTRIYRFQPAMPVRWRGRD